MQDTTPPQPTESMIGKLLVASTTVQDPVLSRSVCLVVHQDTENVFAVLLNRPMTPPPGLAKLLDSKAGEGAGNVAGQTTVQPKSMTTPSISNRFKTSLSNDLSFYPTNLPGGESDSPSEGQSNAPTDESESDPLLAEQAAAEASKSLGTIHFGGPLSGPVVAVHNSSELAEAEAGKGVYVAAQRDLLETLVKQKPGSFRLIVGHLGWGLEELRAEREAGFWHMIDATDEAVFTGDQDLWPSLIRRATTAAVANWLGIRDTSFAGELN